MIPEITTTDLSEKLKSDEKFILLDVRELNELNHAKLTDSRLEVTPMSRLAREGTEALSDAARSLDAMIYVLCHHGNRSGQVTMWLKQQGWRMYSAWQAVSTITREGLIDRWGSTNCLHV